MDRMHRLHSRRGATIVEFATGLPVLLFMTLGVVDLGVLLIARQRLVQATFETGRYAALGANMVTDADITSRAEYTLTTLGQSTEGLSVTITRAYAGVDPVVTVQLQLPFTSAVGLLPLPSSQTQAFTFRDLGV